MYEQSTVIVLHLIDDRREGQWMAVKPRTAPASVWHKGISIPLVATGDIEWNGDVPGEVYVPASRLAEWRAEHSLVDSEFPRDAR